jgi:hypothetical protein
MAFPSKSGGAGHLVQVRTAQKGPEAGKQYVTCSCPGGKFAFAGGNGRGCWAMVEARKLLGLEAR